jgi:hypothetical protein
MNLDDIEAKARAATPGPWEAGACDIKEKHPEVYIKVPDRSHAAVFHDASPTKEQPWHEWTHNDHTEQAAKDVAYMAALSPDVALAMVAEIRRLREALDEREIDMHARIRAGYDKTVADLWRAENDDLAAENERLRACLVDLEEERSGLPVHLRQLVTDALNGLAGSTDQCLEPAQGEGRKDRDNG